jgi:membrane peptidoglycan carboxypeptidase
MSPAPTPRNILGLLGAFLVVAMLGGVVAAGLVMPAVGATGVVTKNSVDFFNSLPSDLAQPPLSEASRLLAADGSTITTFYDEYRHTVDLKDIAPVMQQAIVAIEDNRFYEHGGVDPKGLLRAAIVNKLSGQTEQGASTLTQQYVKNVIAESAVARGDLQGALEARKKSNSRKVKEIRLAVSLENQLSAQLTPLGAKKEILNRYLNIAWFGGKVNGVDAAAKYYFRTSAKKLTLPQAATLAGMIQDPVGYSPEKHPKAALTRRNIVLDKMLEFKNIDQATHDKAVKAKLGARITPQANGCANAGQYGYYCEYVRLQLINNKAFAPALGDTPRERENALKRGGLTITTAMDPKVMKAAWKAVSTRIPPKDTSRVATATVSVEPGTGLVRSIQQNKTYDPNGKYKQGRTGLNYAVDAAYGGGSGFQTGSTFKPFTLATWLQAGKSLNESVPAGPGSAPFSDFTSCGRKLRATKPYTYTNSADGEGNGNMTVWNGTAASVNGVYISMEKQLDLCKIRDMAEDVGVHLASSRPNECPALEKGKTTTRLPICVPAVTLGVENISPMTMAAAYATFSANGLFCKPTVVTSIKNRDGKNLTIPSAGCKQTVDEDVAKGVNLGLSKVFKPGGTASHLCCLPNNRPASGKTGTTNQSINTWFVGYTRQLATAVWVGDPNTKNGIQTTLNRRTVKNHYYRVIYGGTLAGPIWMDITKKAMEGKKVLSFDKPSAKYTRSPNTSVPNVAGKSVSAAKGILNAAGFSKVTISNTPVPSSYPPGSVAGTSPGGNSRTGLDTEIIINISAGGGGGGDGGGGGGGDGGGGNGGGGQGPGGGPGGGPRGPGRGNG